MALVLHRARAATAAARFFTALFIPDKLENDKPYHNEDNRKHGE
jgi:hypothetical protein